MPPPFAELKMKVVKRRCCYLVSREKPWALRPEGGGTAAHGVSVTYDRKKAFCSGWLERAPSQRRLTHVRPTVRGRRVADGKVSPKAVEPTGESHPVSLPGHTQLFHRPMRMKGISDNHCVSRTRQKQSQRPAQHSYFYQELWWGEQWTFANQSRCNSARLRHTLTRHSAQGLLSEGGQLWQQRPVVPMTPFAQGEDV